MQEKRHRLKCLCRYCVRYHSGEVFVEEVRKLSMLTSVVSPPCICPTGFCVARV